MIKQLFQMILIIAYKKQNKNSDRGVEMKKVLLVVLSMIMALSLLMPMVNPVSANTSIMANIAAQLLKDAGRSAIEVGLILRDNFSLDAWDTAQILNNVGYFAIEVGQVLKDIFGLSIPDAAEIMKEVGYSAEVVDRVLRDSTEVAQELKGSGSSSVEVGLILRDEFMLDAQVSAQILRGVGYSAIDVGQVLNDVFGLEARYGARIMKNLGHSAQEIYEVLTSASAFGIDGTEEIEIENILRYAGYEDEEFMDITAFETVKKFTPILWFDQAYWGLPMSAQEYFDRVMNEPTNSPQMTQEYIWWTTGYYGPCPQWPDCSQCGMIPLCGRGGPEGGCVCGIENSDFNTLLNGEVPTYYHVISEPGGRLRIQYWWFYGWQGPCNTSLYTESDGAHHGDWERMIVTSSEGRQYVEAVTFIFHGDYYTRLKDNYLEQDGRPIAYVGKKAHGTYHNDDLSGYGGLGSALNCCEYADYRNEVDSSKWYNANDNLVSLNLNSEEWMLADRIGSTYEYNGQEYTIWNIHESSGTWRWGPCNWYETVTDVVCEPSCGTHPTIFPPVWWIPSCGGAGCGDSKVFCPDRDFDQGWPTFVFPPSQPTGISPPDGAENVVLNPTLESSDFKDLAGGTYQASQWQVTTTTGDFANYISYRFVPVTRAPSPRATFFVNIPYRVFLTVIFVG